MQNDFNIEDERLRAYGPQTLPKQIDESFAAKAFEASPWLQPRIHGVLIQRNLDGSERLEFVL